MFGFVFDRTPCRCRPVAARGGAQPSTSASIRPCLIAWMNAR
jgi:hypothetical protein